MVPALLDVHLKVPQWKPWLEFLSIVPWALPGVVLALAMIRAYIGPFNVSRPALLILTYVLLSLPFMFRSIDASLSAINARTLVEAAQMLGAGWLDISRRVFIPRHLAWLDQRTLVDCRPRRRRICPRLPDGRVRLENLPHLPGPDPGIDGRIASALAVIGLLYVLAFP